jgi:hypothetical protein
MLPWIRAHLTFANVVSLAALFFALGGTATAVTYVVSSNSQIGPGTVSGHKPPTGKHANIIRGSVNGTDLAGGAVTTGKLGSNSVDGSKVVDGSLGGSDIAQNNSITGSNIDESTLGQVPNATVGELGGLGRFTGNGSCNPSSNAYLDCAITTINLPAATSVLLIGHVTAGADGADPWTGNCKLVTNSGDVPATGQYFYGSGDVEEAGALVGITGALAAGSHDFAVDCEQDNGIKYAGVGIVAIAISPY